MRNLDMDDTPTVAVLGTVADRRAALIEGLYATNRRTEAREPTFAIADHHDLLAYADGLLVALGKSNAPRTARHNRQRPTQWPAWWMAFSTPLWKPTAILKHDALRVCQE